MKWKRSQVCESCRYFYNDNKKRFDQDKVACLANQDCRIRNGDLGCLKCRMTKTIPFIKSNKDESFRSFFFSYYIYIFFFIKKVNKTNDENCPPQSPLNLSASQPIFHSSAFVVSSEPSLFEDTTETSIADFDLFLETYLTDIEKEILLGDSKVLLIENTEASTQVKYM